MEYFKDCMTIEQLEQEHKKLVIQLHPDRNPDNPNATADFQEMQAQYEERKAELKGDYTKARRGRERREREERERKERERREQGRRKVEQAVRQARENKSKHYLDLKAGDYVYAKRVNLGVVNPSDLSLDSLLRRIVIENVNNEVVVKIEVVVDMDDQDFFTKPFSDYMPEGLFGGWETLQQADPANGVPKARRVAKVVMFRCKSGDKDLCVLGNPLGDPSIRVFYMPHDYDDMYSCELDIQRAAIERERQEKIRIKQEREARIEAEQRPLIDEWKDKLIAISAGLTPKERETVAISNVKTLLKTKFPGVKFSIKTDRYGDASLRWEDGPTIAEVIAATELFNSWLKPLETTPWKKQFGEIRISAADFDRKMSVLTKARILQDLGSVTEAFCEGDLYDNVVVSDFDWQMLHMLVGINISDPDVPPCQSEFHEGKRKVRILDAVRYVFERSRYMKATKKTTKRSKQAA